MLAAIRSARSRAGEALLWFDEKPLVVVLAAAGATTATVALLCAYAGWTPMRREAIARVLGAVLSVAALLASGLLFFGLDGHAGYATTLPALLILPVAAAALRATSPARVRRLSRPQTGPARRHLANGVAGAAYVRRLLLSPREHGLGCLRRRRAGSGARPCELEELRLRLRAAERRPA